MSEPKLSLIATVILEEDISLESGECVHVYMEVGTGKCKLVRPFISEVNAVIEKTSFNDWWGG